MRINTLIHSVLLFTLCVLVMPLQAQDDWCNRAKKNMEQAWKEGNYKQVETFYNNTYLGERKCSRDKNIELKIAERKKTKTSTTGTTSNNQKNKQNQQAKQDNSKQASDTNKPSTKKDGKNQSGKKSNDEIPNNTTTASSAEDVKPPNQPVQKGSTSSSPASKDQTITVNGVSFKMVYVEGGTFTMGCTGEQGSDCWSYEKPAHQVTLSSYSIGETEVTQALWKAVMGYNPSYYKGDDLPVENVSWDDVQTFISELNRKTGRTFQLPTEAEWEYAARGGSKSNGYKYSGSNTRDDVAWYWDNSGDKTHPVKTKKANELGLYDMSGNVWEWCSDAWYHYGSSAERDPKHYGDSGSYRVIRGGSWDYYARGCRVSSRDFILASYRGSYLGFRLVLVQ